ncbi:hypothetical protein TWF481_011374 [Arthrobotrys musiformis]|uniref:Uncharacterized protein n=1 Tax=Arthrobotrys musiformis TaxID=47236 RepID=A0AAV9W149_9PEZI
MSTAPDPTGSGSPEWILVNPEDCFSPGHDYLLSPTLNVLSSSLGNLDLGTPGTSRHTTWNCSVGASPRPTRPLSLMFTPYGKLEISCDACASRHMQYPWNTHPRRNHRTNFTVLPIDHGINISDENTGRGVNMHNRPAVETLTNDEIVKIRTEISTLNSNPQDSLLEAGYDPEELGGMDALNHRWRIAEQFVYRKPSCPDCFTVYLEYQYSQD